MNVLYDDVIAITFMFCNRFHWKTLDYFDTLSSKSLIITVSICFAFHLAAFAIHPLFKVCDFHFFSCEIC